METRDFDIARVALNLRVQKREGEREREREKDEDEDEGYLVMNLTNPFGGVK